MYKNVVTPAQLQLAKKLLPVTKGFYLAGGTALAFQIGHRRLIAKAKEIFENNFNAKLFREQLCYFDDIDNSESIEYIDIAPDDNEIQEFLEAIAIKI